MLCSTATRTRETLARTRIDAPVNYVDRLYDATPGAVIEEINSVESRFGPDVETAVGDRPRAGDVVGSSWPGHRGTEAIAPRPNAFRRSSRRLAIAVLRTGEPWDCRRFGIPVVSVDLPSGLAADSAGPPIGD